MYRSRYKKNLLMAFSIKRTIISVIHYFYRYRCSLKFMRNDALALFSTEYLSSTIFKDRFFYTAWLFFSWCYFSCESYSLFLSLNGCVSGSQHLIRDHIYAFGIEPSFFPHRYFKDMRHWHLTVGDWQVCSSPSPCAPSGRHLPLSLLAVYVSWHLMHVF